MCYNCINYDSDYESSEYLTMGCNTCKYNPDALNKSGLNKSGLNESGLNESGLNESGLNKSDLNFSILIVNPKKHNTYNHKQWQYLESIFKKTSHISGKDKLIYLEHIKTSLTKLGNAVVTHARILAWFKNRRFRDINKIKRKLKGNRQPYKTKGNTPLINR